MPSPDETEKPWYSRKKNLWIALWVVIAAFFFWSVSRAAADEVKPLTADQAKKFFQSAFPNVKVDEFGPSSVNGLWEVVTQGNIVYYQEPNTLVVGAIIRNNVNETDLRKDTLATAKLDNLPLDKAIKIGNGKQVIIEVSDPDCTYCRLGGKFLSTNAATDATRYVFLYPLPIHPDAPSKAKYILCQKEKDRGRAYEEALAGKMDDKMYQIPKSCDTAKVDALLQEHTKIAQDLGVNGTPLYFVGKQRVNGADTGRLTTLLKSTN